ncbi:MAG TPA: DUF4190 domain-containing protein [Anaerolineaceae bacterium]|nr:DUF4190 domain-containing protein [Anaerolineaceae bacterium]
MTFDPSTPPPAPVEMPSISQPPAPAEKTWPAITALVLGIINICGSCFPVCGGFMGIIGVIFGIMGLKTSKRTLAMIGLILSALAVVLNIIATIYWGANWDEIIRQLEPYMQ